MKGLINVQNNDNRCFLWCHVRHLNYKDKNLSRIAKEDRVSAKNLDYNSIEFPVSKKDYCKVSVMDKININVSCYEEKVVFPVYLSEF